MRAWKVSMVHFGFHTKLIQVTLSALFCSMKLTLCFTDQENTFVGINPSVLNKNRYIIKQCPYTCCPLNATGLMELFLCSGSIGNIRLLQKTYHVIEAVEYMYILYFFLIWGLLYMVRRWIIKIPKHFVMFPNIFIKWYYNYSCLIDWLTFDWKMFWICILLSEETKELLEYMEFKDCKVSLNAS